MRVSYKLLCFLLILCCFQSAFSQQPIKKPKQPVKKTQTTVKKKKVVAKKISAEDAKKIAAIKKQQEAAQRVADSIKRENDAIVRKKDSIDAIKIAKKIERDSIKKDTARMYRKIQVYSEKHKFTSFLHKLIFEPVAKQKIKQSSFHKKRKKITYDQVQGKIIRRINITTLDPFGNSDTDSTVVPTGFGTKLGNSLHNKTHNFAIRNLMLIKKHKPLDSLLVKESERLIRSQGFVRSVTIYPNPVAKTDSVDLNIRVLDNWSLIGDFSTSTTRTNVSVTDRNFLGTGHEFYNRYSKGLEDKKDAYSTSYMIPNIMNTFIRTTVSYEVDPEQNYGKLLNVERPFFSPFARWGAGVRIDQQYRQSSTIDADSLIRIDNIKYNSQDYWGGYATRLFHGDSEKHRTTNLIATARFLNVDYLERPTIAYDSVGFYSDERLYLGGIGISSRTFTQDKYLFRFNQIEDVASGVIYHLTTGFQTKNDRERFYIGARVAVGEYFDFGYLSANVEYGTFYKNWRAEQGALVFNAVYFTNLLESGRWKLRQFIKPELIIGTRRLAIDADRISLNGETGIQGFDDTRLFGTKKLLIAFQTQGYSPWNLWGFRLNPFFNYTMGMLAGEHSGFKTSKVYSNFGIGFIVSNDYLVFGTFQVSVSYYPIIPGNDGSLFKTNAFQTSDFTLPNFELSKPVVVPYR